MVERETGTNLVLDDIDGHGVAGGEMRRRRNENNVDDDDDELQPQPPPQPQQGQEQQHQPPFGPAWQNVLPRPLIGHPAVVAFQDSGASFLVSDPRLPGNPIVYANEGFLELTGYPVERVLGRNCRFLQGPETDPVAVASMREAIDREDDVIARVLNYRFDGTTFWNEIFISAVRDEHGDLIYFLGLQQLVGNGGDGNQEEQWIEAA